MTKSRALPLGLLAATLVVAPLAGCNKDENKPSPAASSASKAPEVKGVTLPGQAAFKGEAKGALVDVKIVDCPTDAGEQTAKLELTNSTKAARDYSIMVIWLKNGNGTPLGASVVKQKAAEPGKKIALEAKAKVVDKADKCALNVLAGTIK